MRTRQIGFHVSRILLGRLLLCVCLLSPVTVGAQETFQLLKTLTTRPDCPPAKSYTLLTDEIQATFLPPDDCILQINRENHALWVTFADSRCQIKVQISTNSPELLKPEHADDLRNVVGSRYPKASVTPGEECHTSCGLGHSFDIQQLTAYKTKLTTRLVFMPIRGGVLEISMTASEGKFKSQLLPLGRILHSMRVEKADLTTLTIRKD